LSEVPLTWEKLLVSQLSDVRVFVLYFPSRFDTEADRDASEMLRTFGAHTGNHTCVSFWDPTDAEFSRALELFDIKSPPALVCAPGLQLRGVMSSTGDTHIYALAITDPTVLGNRKELESAINTTHEVVMRGNPREVSGYLRERKASAILSALAHGSSGFLDRLVRLKPRISLPGGVGLALG
jgi:hypothetical protein